MATSRSFSTRDTMNGEDEVKHRGCDDMLARRLARNLPSQHKNSTVNNPNKFLTPTGNPLQYVRERKKSKALDDLEDEKAATNQERDEKNVRYKEMETLKDMLKEEESQWTSKLDNWKQKRLSATFDVRQRSEERQSIMMKQAETVTTPRRKAKTYREIIEEKKRRDAGGLDRNSYNFSSSFDFSTDEDNFFERGVTKKPYRGAVSVPALTIKNNDAADSFAQDDSAEKELPEHNDNATSHGSNFNQVPTQTISAASLPNTTSKAEIAVPSSASSNTKFSNRNTNQSNNKSLDYAARTLTSAPQMRNNTYKNSAASMHNTHANTLPARHSASTESNYSSESDLNPSQADGFSNRKSMWENISASKQTLKRPPSVPIDLSTLLKQDDEKLQMNGTSSHSDSCSQTSSDSYAEQLSKPAFHEASNHIGHKPKIMGSSYNHASTALSRQDLSHTQHAFEPIHKYGNSPAILGSLSSTLPSKPRISSVEEKNKQREEASLRLNISGLKGPAFSPRPSPRSGVGGISSMFEDLNISINQRPKCEKGFGFTVRGGDDGKPVVVNTVSPGGAADLCHLQVGDEILSINEVRLSDALTQDDIVQLIVNSVISGSLSLTVRRYGKSKKATPRPFPGGLKTSAGLLPTRANKDIFSNLKQSSNDNNGDALTTLSDQKPDPPALSKPQFITSSQRAKAKQPRQPLFRNQIMASQTGNRNLFSGKENKREDFTTGVGNYKSTSYPFNTTKHRPLNVVVKEWSAWPQDTGKTQENEFETSENHVNSVGEVKREEEKRKRIEEALAEERRITAQLKKIEAAKLEQGRKHEENKRKFILSESPSLYSRFFHKPSKLKDDFTKGNGDGNRTNNGFYHAN